MHHHFESRICSFRSFALSFLEEDSISSQVRGGVRYFPMAFTEPGVAMLSEMLVSHADLLNRVNHLEHLLAGHDNKILLIFEYLRQLEQARQQLDDQANRRKIGFRQEGD